MSEKIYMPKLHLRLMVVVLYLALGFTLLCACGWAVTTIEPVGWRIVVMIMMGTAVGLSARGLKAGIREEYEIADEKGQGQ